MPKIDPRYAQLHKEIYSAFLDELDADVVMAIMTDPTCEEALLLSERVEAEIKRRLVESLGNS
jgi:ABC-type antimicrobial peptide transport system permease subunit